nr:MAG TPA: hypothetical protein [Caudoviricetes sp.]
MRLSKPCRTSSCSSSERALLILFFIFVSILC